MGLGIGKHRNRKVAGFRDCVRINNWRHVLDKNKRTWVKLQVFLGFSSLFTLFFTFFANDSFFICPRARLFHEKSDLVYAGTSLFVAM